MRIVPIAWLFVCAAWSGSSDPSASQSQSTQGRVLYCSAALGQVTASQAASLSDVLLCSERQARPRAPSARACLSPVP